jgi:hypothetical protein
MKMPFGEHAGAELCDVPEGYVNWLGGRELVRPAQIRGQRRDPASENRGAPEPRLVSFPARHLKIPSGDVALAKGLINLGHHLLSQQTRG